MLAKVKWYLVWKNVKWTKQFYLNPIDFDVVLQIYTGVASPEIEGNAACHKNHKNTVYFMTNLCYTGFKGGMSDG